VSCLPPETSRRNSSPPWRATSSPAQTLGDGGQELVAGLVAEAVVDELEVVEVDEEDGERLLPGLAVADCALELLLERDPVGEVGEGVVVGDVPQLALGVGELVRGLLALGDVDDDPVNEEPTVLGTPRVHAVPHPAGTSVVAEEAVFDLEGLVALDRLAGDVVLGPVLRVDGVLPGLLRRAVVGQRPEQALEAGADEGVADVAPVRPHLHLVDVDGDRSGHAKEDVARVRHEVVVAGLGHG
jgi:hypothetical protein